MKIFTQIFGTTLPWVALVFVGLFAITYEPSFWNTLWASGVVLSGAAWGFAKKENKG